MNEQLATLCYILKDGQLLLIRKKRGIGAGKINGPGGKVDPDELPLAAAIRETEEEVGVTPVDPGLRGELVFYFKDGPTLRCLIYLARDFLGTPHETDEAVPLWYPVDALPYDQMWEDDREWLPLLLAEKHFKGTVRVEGETATSHTISLSESYNLYQK